VFYVESAQKYFGTHNRRNEEGTAIYK
jgi:hypothetical protein